MNEQIAYVCGCHASSAQCTGWPGVEPCAECGEVVRAVNITALEAENAVLKAKTKIERHFYDEAIAENAALRETNRDYHRAATAHEQTSIRLEAENAALKAYLLDLGVPEDVVTSVIEKARV